eukprot:TRINITY_DN2906_c0_g2_i4.p1 TRINITY_DN2906_c0_g2~~TRINITY_DN2906_c0_g2_i4.p1  ORF type:complete len:205 (-),score=-14.01 TRINITY_DN2906_c0_g2_i4:623-1237(-)
MFTYYTGVYILQYYYNIDTTSILYYFSSIIYVSNYVLQITNCNSNIRTFLSYRLKYLGLNDRGPGVIFLVFYLSKTKLVYLSSISESMFRRSNTTSTFIKMFKFYSFNLFKRYLSLFVLDQVNVTTMYLCYPFFSSQFLLIFHNLSQFAYHSQQLLMLLKDWVFCNFNFLQTFFKRNIIQVIVVFMVQEYSEYFQLISFKMFVG